MTKYHLNNANQAMVCKASMPERCTFYRGEDDSRHYDDIDAATKAAEELSEKQFSAVSTMSKNDVWKMHVESAEDTAKAMDHVKKLAEAKDEQGLNDFIESRVNSDVQMNVIATLEDLAAQEKAIRDERAMYEKMLKDSTRTRNPIYLDPETEAEMLQKLSNVGARERNLRLLDIYENKKALENKFNAYRSVAAVAAYESSVLREERERAAGTFLTYDKDTIGILKSEAAYEPNSPEWHAARARGIGGSDIGAILRADKEFATKNYEQMIKAKLGLPPEEVETGPDSPIGRGNCWEEKIRQDFIDRNPHLNVAFSKDSWVGQGDKSYLKSNFDGLLLDDEGNAVGIVEIKTGRTYDGKWGNVEDGIDAVPLSYAYQAIYYAKNGNLKKGVIVALLNDNDYREYHFSMDDPRVQAMANKIDVEVEKFIPKLKKIKEDHANGIDVFESKAPKGFPKSHDASKMADNLMLYTGAHKNEKIKYMHAVSEAYDDWGDDGVRSLYAQYHPSQGRNVPMVGIDIETSGLSSTTGHIIEASVVEIDKDGNQKILFDSMFDIPERAHAAGGMGATDVHGITADMVKGKPYFTDPDVQKKLGDALRGKIIVAHNAPFENTWLTTFLDGHAEERDKGNVRLLDTKDLTRDLMVNTKNNKMESFTTGNGVEYESAHRSLADTQMMMESLHKLQSGNGYKFG